MSSVFLNRHFGAKHIYGVKVHSTWRHAARQLGYFNLMFCQAAYRKIKQPDKFLTTAEKWAIARIYNLKEEYLFPELEDMG
jgi:hypothetical protein